MSADIDNRRAEFEAEALRVNAGRKPKFGDLMRNPWAGEGNPTRDGYFVRAKTVTGRFNPGLWYEFTDGNGKFWESSGKCAMFVEGGRLVALSGKGDAEQDQGFVPPPFAASAFSDEEYAGIRFRFFKLLSDAERLNVFRVFLGLSEKALAEVTTHYVESKLLNAMLAGRFRAQGGMTSKENGFATAPSQAKSEGDAK